MTYTVTRRDQKGHTVSETFQADSRAALFVLLKERGIVAIRISEGVAKSSSKVSSRAKKRVMISAAMLFIAGILASLLFWVNNLPKTAVKQVAEEKIKEVKRTAISEKRSAAPKLEKKSNRFWEVDASQTNGFTEVQLRKWRKEHRVRPSYTNTTSRTEKKPEYAIFKTHCENEIACYLTLRPGETLVGTPHYTKKQIKEFIAALDEPMIYNKDETDEQRELRAAVQETKEDLKKRIAAGEDIGEILKATREEFQSLAQYKHEISQLLSELQKDPNTTIEEVDLMVGAANLKLEEKGIAPLKLGVITRRMLQKYRDTKKGVEK